MAGQGKRGPATKPRALKVIAGEKRPSRIGNAPRAVPKAGSKPPRMPSGLPEGTARHIWHRLAPLLHKHGLLGPHNTTMFAEYCRAAHLVQEAADELAKSGVVVTQMFTDKDGNQRALRRAKNPAFQVWRDATGTMVALARQFGLTPSAEAELDVSLGAEAANDAAAADGLLTRPG